jgi:biotin transport system substrate-specific component
MQTMLGVALVILATTLGAQITPFAGTGWADTVPGTLQTLAVLAGGALLGPRRGALAMVGYLALGLVGVPVFHDWSSYTPLEFAQYPSAGYLLGFIAGAAFAGWAAARVCGFPLLLLVMLAGHLIVLAMGVPVLAAYSDLGSAIEVGFLVLLPGMALKSVLGAALVYVVRERRRTSTKAS